MSFKLAQINIGPNKKTGLASDIFIAQPDSLKESLAGRLFLLIEVAGNNPANLKIINYLIDKLNFNYYQNEKILLREKISSLKVEHIFEAALAKTNKNFSDFIKSEKLSLAHIKINVTAGVLYENTLYFANTGKNKVLLIYPKAKTKAKAQSPDRDYEKKEKAFPAYQISNLVERTNDKPHDNKISPEKLFSFVFSGPIPAKSQFVIANEALPEYIASGELIRIVSSLPPTSAVEQIKNHLQSINTYVNFLALIIKRTTLDQAVLSPAPAWVSTQDSISALNRTEEATENLLSPSGLINIAKWFSVFNFKKYIKKTGSLSGGEQLTIKDKILVKRKPVFIFKKLSLVFKTIFLYLINLIYFTFKIIKDTEKRRAALLNYKTKISTPVNSFYSGLINLSKKSKLLLILSLALIIIFLLNIGFETKEKEKAEEEVEYNTIISQIEKKQNQAEANLLYSNDEGAQDLFSEIKNLLGQLPQETPEQKEQYDKFRDKFNFQLEKVRRVVRIDGAENLADLSKLSLAANAVNLTLAENTTKLYAADSKEKSFYIIDTKDNSVTTLTNLELDITLLSSPALNDNSIYYFNNNSIIEINTDAEEMSSLALDVQGTPGEIVSQGTYNSRLYLLNSKTNQVYRYDRAGQKFISPRYWIQENLDLSRAVDMSIDGHVYILLDNAEVIKLLRGTAQDFSLEEIDPRLESPTKIKVSAELKYIYILEPINQRLAVYDKTGQFLLQYQSPLFENLKDFAVDEKNKILFFLNDNSVYKFNANHFEE